MHEFAIANVDSDMRVGFLACIEEYEIAGLHFGLCNLLSKTAHFRGAARQTDIGGVLVNVFDKAAAIEAFLRIVAAEFIGCADQAQGFQQWLGPGFDAIGNGLICGFLGGNQVGECQCGNQGYDDWRESHE